MSPGTGADITGQEAADIIKKWLTEKTTMQACFASGAGVTVFVKGQIWMVPNEQRLGVSHPNPGIGSPIIFFDPSIALSCKYGDTRAFDNTALELAAIGAPAMVAALVFVFPDGAQLGLWELAE